MLDINQSLEKFYALAPEVYLTVDSEEIGDRMEKINNKYNINIGALIIFLTVSDMERKDIKDYLKQEFSLGDKMVAEIEQDMETQILQPIEHRLSFLNNNPNKDQKQIEEDKKTLNTIFEKKIKKELASHPVIINAINLRIFFNLSQNLNFKNELEKSLLNNEEVISGKKFIYQGREKSPSIANWIHYFIEVNGSEMFDNIILSRFLVDSVNTKLLSPEEREILKKVLNIYRNIRFFPDSMPSDDGEGWEIIPTGLEKYTDNSISIEKITNKTEEQAPVNDDEEEALAGLDEKTVLPGQDLNIEKILELEKMLHKFQVGSLEARVIEEEIKRLKKDKD